MSCVEEFVCKCHKILLSSSKEAKNAREYLGERGITAKSISLYKIGYCPNIQIPDKISSYGWDGKAEKPNYSYFIKGKIIVPIYDEFEKEVWFATRKPSTESGNTWWNLPKPFHKGNHLFLLNKNRKHIFKDNKIYLVEGYADAILLQQEGLKAVCGLMGTALTPRKIGLIIRYCDNICLCMDIDENKSGQNAQDKSVYALSEFGFCESISVIDNLPVGEDPAEFVIKNGLQKFLEGERKLDEKEIKKICNRVRYKNYKK